MKTPESAGLPLTAYAVEGDSDMEQLAREVLSQNPQERLEPTPQR